MIAALMLPTHSLSLAVSRRMLSNGTWSTTCDQQSQLRCRLPATELLLLTAAAAAWISRDSGQPPGYRSFQYKRSNRNIKVALSSVYKANAALRPTVHHGTVPEFCCRWSANRRDHCRNGGQDSIREQPRNSASWPASDP